MLEQLQSLAEQGQTRAAIPGKPSGMRASHPAHRIAVFPSITADWTAAVKRAIDAVKQAVQVGSEALCATMTAR